MDDAEKCAKCDECSANGYKYCTGCGRPTDAVTVSAYGNDTEKCERCDECFANGYAYCTGCGRLINTGAASGMQAMRAGNIRQEESGFAKIVKISGLLLLLLCTPMLIFEIFMIFYGFGDIWHDIIDYELCIFLLNPSPYEALWFGGNLTRLYYLFLVVSALGSFAILLYCSRKGIGAIFQRRPYKHDDIPLYAVITLFAAIMTFTLAYVLGLGFFGIKMETPFAVAPVWDQWLGLLNASVWEEVLCRILMVGIPMTVIGLLMRKKGSLKRIFGHFKMDTIALIVVIASSAIFAYGHLENWDVFKLPQVFVMGLALGYVFVKFGIYASIMLHFMVDYLSTAMWIFGDDIGAGMIGLFVLSFILFGAVFFVKYTKQAIVFTKNAIQRNAGSATDDGATGL